MKRLTLFLIVALLFVGVGADAKKKAKKNSEDAKMEKEIVKIMDEGLVKGMSVVFFKGNDVIYQKAFGWKDEETKVPLDINDKFRIASISKSFSAASMMQLVEQGKVSLDTDINDIMGMSIRNPRFPDEPITVKMLLSHTSSMVDGPGGAAKYRDLTYIDPTRQDKNELMKRFAKYAPGKGYKYCNRAFNMMGCVIERVSGERFDNYIRQHILLPMGIEDAGFNIDSLDQSNIASLYIYNKKDGSFKKSTAAYNRKEGAEQAIDKGKYVIGNNGWGWSPTGGMKISAPNLAKWAMTLKAGGVAPNGVRIIPEEGVKEMLTPKTDAETPGSTWYGFAIRITNDIIPGVQLKGHTGSAQGLKSAMFFSPEGDWGFVVISTSTNGEAVAHCSAANAKVARLLYERYAK